MRGSYSQQLEKGRVRSGFYKSEPGERAAEVAVRRVLASEE